MNIKDIETRLLEGRLDVRYHNGVGMMQAYLTEDVRMHVWHPELTTPLESFGNRHDHRFSLESIILLGAIVDIQYQELDGEGPFNIYEVKPAHFGDTPTPQLLSCEHAFSPESIQKHCTGDRYWVPKRIVHETRAEGLTVTIMRKFDQEEQWARIIATKDQQPEHAMLRKPDKALMQQLFFSALRKLPTVANSDIAFLTNS